MLRKQFICLPRSSTFARRSNEVNVYVNNSGEQSGDGTVQRSFQLIGQEGYELTAHPGGDFGVVLCLGDRCEHRQPRD